MELFYTKVCICCLEVLVDDVVLIIFGTTMQGYYNRGELTVATCGKKVTMLRCEDYLVLFKVVERSTLYPLVSYSYQMINKGLLSAFF